MTLTEAAGNAVLLVTVLSLFTGTFLVLRRALLSALVVSPLVFLVPWGSPAFASAGPDYFPLVLALAWTFWMYLGNGDGKRNPRDIMSHPLPLCVVSLACAAAVVAAPQSWTILALISAYELWKHAGRRSLLLSAAIFAVPVAFRLAVWIPAAIAAGIVLSPSSWWDAWIAGDWTGIGYCQALSPAHVLEIRNGVDAVFWWPLVPGFILGCLDFRHMWWFAPTMLWCALLATGSLLIGRQAVLFHSMPLQMALLVPFGICAVLQILRARGSACAVSDNA